MIRAVAIFLATCGVAQSAPFSFVALGDTAYNGERDYPVYRQLIGKINAAQPAFTIHIGDIWGAGDCHDERIELVHGFFKEYAGPLIYTPGDNEWTDCDSRTMGGYESIERLDKLRQVFFASKRSLGRKPITLTRQSDVAPFQAYVENQRWEHQQVVFFTINVPGSNNNFQPEDLVDMTEAFNRNEANVAWIRDGFRVAQQRDAKAVVIAFHAEIFEGRGQRYGAYHSIVEELRLGAERFGKPVLVVHGDSHQFTVDRPLLQSRGEAETPANANLVRLEVFGAPEIKAVRVNVEPDTPWVFSFAPLY